MAKDLWKTTIVIWSEYSPQIELEALARDATSGSAYCSKQEAVHIADAKSDPDWDGTEFFDDAWPEEDGA